MSIDVAAALADAHEEQAEAAPTARLVAGPGPRRPMPYIAAVRAGDLMVDRTYQRDLDRYRVRKMAEAWDPTMLGVLDVADRGPTTGPRYAIINGQHRHAVALLADPRGPDTPLVCNVHRGLTVEGEARLFHELDAATKKLNSWDHWKARRAAGDQVVTAIDTVAASYGLRIAPGQAAGYCGAAGSLEILHGLGGVKLVDATLAALYAAYGNDWSAYLAPLVMGVGLLLHCYPDVDPERIDQALTKSTPQQLRSHAVALRELFPAALSRLVAQVLVNRMNTGRGTKLPDVRHQVPALRLRRATVKGGDV